MDYILSFDVGTSTMKAILVNEKGHVESSASATYGISFPSEGFAEQNPQDLWGAVISTCRAAMENSKVSSREVKGIVFATQGAGVIPISAKDGKAMCPAIIWMDGRAGDEAKEVMELLGGAAAFEEATGIRLTGKDVLAKIRWLYNNRPNIVKNMDCFLDINGYLIYRCTGEKVYDIGSASAVCYDPETRSIVEEAVAVTGFDPKKFPRLVESQELVGCLTEKAADELGLTTATKVFGGTNDMQSTALGSGMTSEGEAHFYLGTSGWVAAITQKASLLSNGGNCIQSAQAGKNLWFYTTETACAVFNWCVDQFFPHEKEEYSLRQLYSYIDSLIEKVPAGSDYLIFNPWVSGERSPVPDIYARGAFLNLCMTHTTAHMLRALYEGVAFNLRWACEGLEQDIGHKVPTLRILGGGTKSKLWMSIFADIFNRPVEIVRDTQVAGAIGAAFLAALGLGIYDSFDDVKQWVRVESVYYPNPENVAIYEEMYQNFKKSYGCLKDFYYDMNKARIKE